MRIPLSMNQTEGIPATERVSIRKGISGVFMQVLSGKVHRNRHYAMERDL